MRKYDKQIDPIFYVVSNMSKTALPNVVSNFRQCKGKNSLKLTIVKTIILRINFRIIVTF